MKSDNKEISYEQNNVIVGLTVIKGGIPMLIENYSEKPIEREVYSMKRGGTLKIQYAIKRSTKAGNGLLFVKVGQDGDIYGYGGKYLDLASAWKERLNVIISSNPFEGSNQLSDAVGYLEEENIAGKLEIDKNDIYYMGHSNGALLAALYAYKYANYFSRILLVNMPLKDSYYGYIKGRLQKYSGKVVFVYGEEDKYFKKASEELPRAFPEARLEIIEGADHHFSKSMDAFLRLPEFLLQCDK